MTDNEASLETVRSRLAAIPDEIIKAEKHIKDLKMEQYQLAVTIRILERRFK